MQRLFLSVVLAAALAAPALAASSRKSLEALEPQTRLEQVCDLEVMRRIAKDPGAYNPDRVVADARLNPAMDEHRVRAEGGAFRSGGHWYEITFDCRASADHMKVEALSYVIGREIPEERWEDYGLWQ